MDKDIDERADLECLSMPLATPTLAMVASRLGIEGAFVRPNDLAKLLGVSSNAIRSLARQGSFPIPHRRIGKAILFKMEDVAAWHDRQAPEPPMTATVAEAGPALAASRVRKPRAPRRSGSSRQSLEEDKQLAARIKAKVLAEMAREKAINVP